MEKQQDIVLILPEAEEISSVLHETGNVLIKKKTLKSLMTGVLCLKTTFLLGFFFFAEYYSFSIIKDQS